MEINEIMKVLPHRYPFLLIDRVKSFEAHKNLVATKNVTINEPFFNGHFPGHPVMPGVLIIEGMAQAAGAICMMAGEIEADVVYFMTIDNARFRKPVVPGDVLELHVQKTKKRGNIWKFHCDAIVDGNKVAEADIGAMLVANESAE